ncbi:YciI family protein [Streptomyces sp. NPDC000963]
MFFLINTYTVPTATIDKALPRHRRWVEHHFAEGHFVFGGRREPRTGGFVVAASDDEAEVRGYLRDEPLFAEGLVTWQVVGLVPQLVANASLREVLDSFGASTVLPGAAGESSDESSGVRVRVNGEERELPASTAVRLLVEEMCEIHRVDQGAVSASLNGEVLPQEKWGTTMGTGSDLRLAVLTPGG